jgi:uncharacterized protein HemX
VDKADIVVLAAKRDSISREDDMKKTMVLLAGALILLIVPALATAAPRQDKQRGDTLQVEAQRRHQQVETQQRHQQAELNRGKDIYARPQRELKPEPRKTEWQLQQIKRQQQRPTRVVVQRQPVPLPHHLRPAPPIVVGLPRIILSFGW